MNKIADRDMSKRSEEPPGAYRFPSGRRAGRGEGQGRGRALGSLYWPVVRELLDTSRQGGAIMLIKKIMILIPMVFVIMAFAWMVEGMYGGRK